MKVMKITLLIISLCFLQAKSEEMQVQLARMKIMAEEEKENAVNKPKNEEKSSVTSGEEKLSYEAALKDIADDEVAFRGHGLIALTKLVEAKDEETISHISEVITIFQVIKSFHFFKNFCISTFKLYF